MRGEGGSIVSHDTRQRCTVHGKEFNTCIDLFKGQCMYFKFQKRNHNFSKKEIRNMENNCIYILL